jgi:phosphate transport system substrate-binding protein
MKFRFSIITILIISVWACKETGKKESSPTLGEITIACDEQLREVIQQEEEIFERDYKYAKVELMYRNESTVFKLLKADSLQSAITCRGFNDSEISFFKSKRMVTPRSFPFAKAAMALLCNAEIKDTGMVYEDFVNLCNGNETQSRFKVIVVEDVGSGIAQFLLDKIQTGQFGKNVFALQNKDSIFNYLSLNKQAIAVVDWSEFSDSDNSSQQARLKKYKVLGISRPKDSLQMGFLHPDQYVLQDDKYPLIRTYHFLSVSGKSDLGVGFGSFITGDIGQRILLKAGLLPLYQTERWIELKNGSYKVVE